MKTNYLLSYEILKYVTSVRYNQCVHFIIFRLFHWVIGLICTDNNFITFFLYCLVGTLYHWNRKYLIDPFLFDLINKSCHLFESSHSDSILFHMVRLHYLDQLLLGYIFSWFSVSRIWKSFHTAIALFKSNIILR